MSSTPERQAIQRSRLATIRHVSKFLGTVGDLIARDAKLTTRLEQKLTRARAGIAEYEKSPQRDAMAKKIGRTARTSDAAHKKLVLARRTQRVVTHKLDAIGPSRDLSLDPENREIDRKLARLLAKVEMVHAALAKDVQQLEEAEKEVDGILTMMA